MKQIFSIFFFLLFITLTNSQTFSGTVGTVSDDGQPNDFTATVSGLSSNQLDASLGLVQVCLDISHTYDSDLNVYLIAPDGTTINLFSGIGGGDDNFSNTCLNQNATNSINTATAPFTGIFKPQETLGNCNNNQNGNGVWKLRIIDTYAQDEGIVNQWSITFASNATTIKTEMVFGNCESLILMPKTKALSTNGASLSRAMQQHLLFLLPPIYLSSSSILAVLKLPTNRPSMRP
jgi:subtilisin-like proprotein convertase family protein